MPPDFDDAALAARVADALDDCERRKRHDKHTSVRNKRRVTERTGDGRTEARVTETRPGRVPVVVRPVEEAALLSVAGPTALVLIGVALVVGVVGPAVVEVVVGA